ncbi:MAG: SDR family NAD(P)-dependent oxidoreductase [Proteobacteria bacterium]|nr:SDR family NAD(P)-dependent oxidoreductase [Pseudomonadota bacterium]
MDLQDSVVIVTGSSSGVGAACARQVAERGAHVVINYSSNEAGARETQTACQAYGVETVIVQADVSLDADCRRLVGAAEEKWGRLDGLVNNAGTTKFCPHNDLEGLSKQDFFDIYGVNTVGVFQMTRAAAPLMKRGGMGSIVNVASIAGVMGVGSSIAYAASKGALITMGLSLARVLGPEIRVNTVCPGFIQGEWLAKGMGRENYERSKAHLEQTTPLRLTTTPDTIAESILFFLASASVVTGETLILDGGHHLNQTPTVRR